MDFRRDIQVIVYFGEVCYVQPKLTDYFKRRVGIFVKVIEKETFYVKLCFQRAHLAINQSSLKICINQAVFSLFSYC